MRPDLQKYYEQRLDMMSSEPWRQLMEDVQQMLDATNTLDGVTAENVRFRQGEVSMMRWLLSIKQVSEEAYEGLKNESNA